MNKRQARGYIKSGPFRGQRVPQHIQNKIVRYYCEENNFEYVLSRSEYAFNNSTCHIEAAMREKYQIIVLYSLLQLPISQAKRRRIYSLLAKERKELHFACENMKISCHDFIENLRQIELILGCYDALNTNR